MTTIRMATLMATLLISSAALADNDCTDPVAEWQPQENLRQLMVDNGWQVKRIKVDDGCYEVKGLDQNGNHVEAKFSPASLEILELEIKFTGSGNNSDYLKKQGSPQKSVDELKTKNKNTKKKPKVKIE